MTEEEFVALLCHGRRVAMEDLSPANEDENTCEHGDHEAPANQRYCSAACQRCEEAENPQGDGCVGLCGRPLLAVVPHEEPEPTIVEVCRHKASLLDECMKCEAET